MRLTYDSEANASYLYLVDKIEPGGVAKSHPCDLEVANASVVLDFDKDGKLLGIEIRDADVLLSKDTLETAEDITKSA